MASWFHASVKTISRGAGQSAVAAAAYRSGQSLYDERYGETQDYTRKGGIVSSFILAPDHAPDWVKDRQRLWNEAETAERRGDARLAREMTVALPHEVSGAERETIAREIAAEIVSRYGVAIDVNLHAPHWKGDQRNHHAHFLWTTRTVSAEGMADKTRILDSSKTSGAEIEHIRDFTADAINRALERAQSDERVTAESFEAQGIDREPDAHLGPHASALKRKGEESRIGDENAARSERNSDRAWLHVEALKELARVAAERTRFNDWAADRIGQLESAQALSMLDLTRAHETDLSNLQGELKDIYGPHLRTVEVEADRLSERLVQTGLIASIRRAWSGRADREKLDHLKATIADTYSRMQEPVSALVKRQDAEKARLASLQERRRQEQKTGLDQSQKRKDAVLSAKEKAAKSLWEQASDIERKEAAKKYQTGREWYEAHRRDNPRGERKDVRSDRFSYTDQKEARRAEVQERAARRAEKRQELEQQIYDRATGKNVPRDNFPFQASRETIERQQRIEQQADYDKRQQDKAAAAQPAKAAELARLRENFRSRQDEISRQETPAKDMPASPAFDAPREAAERASEAQRSAAQPSPTQDQDARKQALMDAAERVINQTPDLSKDRGFDR